MNRYLTQNKRFKFQKTIWYSPFNTRNIIVNWGSDSLSAEDFISELGHNIAPNNIP